jgi:hypothetical protein
VGRLSEARGAIFLNGRVARTTTRYYLIIAYRSLVRRLLKLLVIGRRIIVPDYDS